MAEYTLNHGIYYDLLNPLQPDYRAFVEGFCTARTRVLELGSGTGRLSMPLATKCLSLTGVEIDPTMIALAQEKCAAGPGNIDFVLGDFCSAIVDETADFIFFSRDTLALEPSVKRRLRAFRQIKSMLAEDGCCVIILANIERNLAHGRTRRYEKVGSDATGLRLHLVCVREFYAEIMRWIGHDVLTVSKSGSAETYEATVEHGAITLSEIRVMCDAVGLRIDHLFGDYARSAYSPTSPYLIALLSHADGST
jgi:SAM-dependent methyltransferase